MRKASLGNSPITGKHQSNDKSNDKSNGKDNGKDKSRGKAKRTPAKKSGLVLQSPVPNAVASGSGTTQETQSRAKKGGRGRQAKQEMIDEADGVLR
jgi:hypothetical protein